MGATPPAVPPLRCPLCDSGTVEPDPDSPDAALLVCLKCGFRFPAPDPGEPSG